QPGGLYLAQPAPLTVLSGTVYELEKAGNPKGLFSVNGAQNLEGSWIAVGSVKPTMVVAKAKPPMSKHPPEVVKDTNTGTASIDSDRPTLHRKDGSDSGSTSASNTQPASGGSNTSPSDPDKPTLHRRDASDSSGSSGTSGTSSDDADKPTL